MNLSSITQLFAYHHWATDLAIAAVGPLSADALAREVGGSFGSGRGLLAHIVGVEWLWLERLEGRSPPQLPELSACDTGADFRTEWEPTKAAQQRFVSEIDETRLQAPLSYTNLKGEHWSYPLAGVLQHVVNHGTYHRGQLAHVLRQLGEKPASTDYLLFLQG